MGKPSLRPGLGGVGAATAALLLLTILVPAGRVLVVGNFMTLAVLAVSLGLMIGMTGMLAMGHAAFFGVGAYVSTVLNQQLGWSLPVCVVIAVGAAAVVSLAVGYIASSRTAGLYFAIITFAFGEILVEVVNNTTEITGGSEGRGVSFGLRSDFPFGWTIDRFFAVVLVGVVLVTLVVAVVVRTSHFGLRLNAVRESEDLTRALGFDPTVLKTQVFALGSTLAALAGAVFAPMVGFINPELMGVTQSIYILGLLFVGGVNSIAGAFLGVGLLATLPTYLQFDPVLRPLTVGLVMAGVVLASPQDGLVGLIGKGVAKIRRRQAPVAAPRTVAAQERVLERVGSGGAEPSEAVLPAAGGPEPSKGKVPAAALEGEVLLELRDVGCILGGVIALQGVDLTVAEGEIFGIVGPNGAGKTTLFNAITGYVRFQTGDVRWQGESLAGLPPHRVAARGLLRTFQNVGGLGRMTVAENLAVAARSWHSEQMEQVCTLLSLHEDLDRKVADCSLATRKLVGIAMAVVQRPTMLLLDEPLAGLDVVDRGSVIDVIRLVHGLGVTVVLIEHDIDRTLEVADRIAILDVGEKLAEGTPSELMGRTELRDVYLK